MVPVCGFLWTVYSRLNSIFKRKYNAKLQELPRLTHLIKGFNQDVKQKAAIFDDALLKEFMPNEELCEDFMFAMEEDPEMYAAAGLPPPPVPLPTSKALDLEYFFMYF